MSRDNDASAFSANKGILESVRAVALPHLECACARGALGGAHQITQRPAHKLRLQTPEPLSNADIPASSVVAGVRVGSSADGTFIVNPTVEQMEASSLDLLIAGTSAAVLMIEGFCDFLPEEQLLEVQFFVEQH